MKLEDFKAIDKNGEEIAKKSTITSFRGDDWIFEGISRAPISPSEGKVWVSWEGSNREFYPSVFGLKIVAR